MIRIDADSVGRYFVDENGRIFQCTPFCSEPTATFTQIGGPLHVGERPAQLMGAVRAPLFHGLSEATASQLGDELVRMWGPQ